MSEEKTILRKKMRALRNDLFLVKRAGDEIALGERLMSLPAVRNAHVIGVYQSMGSEVCLDSVVDALRKRNPQVIIAYPALLGEDCMEFKAVGAREEPDFLADPLCIVERDAYDWIDPKQIDLLMMPGLAFDKKCNRLGQGGGYYDRYLPRMRGDSIAIGIAFDEQIIDEVPTDEHDLSAGYVVTPSRIITR